MSQRIEEWLERMRKAQNPGPVAKITASRNSRDVGWIYEVSEQTNLGELAERIDNACRDAGFAGTYELKALDAEGRFIAPFAHKAQVTEIVQMGGGAPPLPVSVEESIGVSLRHNRAFAALGLDSIMKAQRATERLMDRLEAEVTELRKENAQLRRKLVDHWDVMHRLNTHEVETRQEKDKIERMGRMGETFANALMARIFGRGATLEGQSVEYRMAMTLFRSLASDLERVQKILPFLTEDERLAAMELMRPREEPPAQPEAPKVNALAAASAAAAVNGGRAA
jgi:hypothetical protein